MTGAHIDRERLARHVGQRRMSLGLSVARAARLAGISRGTWIGLEQGTRKTESYVYSNVERSLNWAPGSVDAILSGGEPMAPETTQPAAPDGVPSSAKQLDDLVTSLFRLARTGDLPTHRAVDLAQQAIETYEREQRAAGRRPRPASEDAPPPAESA